MEYFVISAKFVLLKYYTLSSQLQRLASFSVGCSGRRILSPGQINIMRKWCICAAAKTPSSHLHSRSRAYPFNAKGSLKSSAIHSILLFFFPGTRSKNSSGYPGAKLPEICTPKLVSTKFVMKTCQLVLKTPILDIFSSNDSQVETLMSLSVPKTPSLTSLRSSWGALLRGC